MHRFYAPLTGLFIFALASGYLMTLVPLRINAANDNNILAGVLGGIYYFGLLSGSFRTDRIVRRIGHIRSFAGCIALLSASVLSLALFNSWFFWFVLRFLNGVAVAGVFVVVESWLLCESKIDNRGRMLSVYMVVLYGANALGQLLVAYVDSFSMTPFLVIGILLALSVFPPVMTRMPTPELEESSTFSFRKLYVLTPSGVLGCFAGGLVLGGLYAMLPIYLTDHGLEADSMALFLTITMSGGMALQYPVGHLSDFMDRRKTLVLVTMLGCCSCFLIMQVNHNLWMHLILLFLVGGATFTLYPLAISHSCDHMLPDDIVSGTQGLLLAYSFGACLGPIVASAFMSYFIDGLMIFFISVMGSISLFFLIRMRARPVIYSLEEQPFVPVPRTSPIVSQIDPRRDTEELHEMEEQEKCIR